MVITRAGAGRPLTYTEMDTNFTDLNSRTTLYTYAKDYSTLGDAISAALSDNKPLFLSPYTSYQVNATLTATVTETLEIVGNGATIVESTDITGPILDLTITGSGKIYIHDINCTGARDATGWTGSALSTDSFIQVTGGSPILERIIISGVDYGIRLESTDKAYVSNIVYNGFLVNTATGYNYNAGVRVNQSTDYVVTDVFADNCGNGILIGGPSTGGSIRHIKTDNNWDQAVYLSSANNTVVFDVQSTPGASGGCVLSRGSYNTIEKLYSVGGTLIASATPLVGVTANPAGSGIIFRDISGYGQSAYALYVGSSPTTGHFLSDVLIDGVNWKEVDSGAVTGIVIVGGDATHAAQTGYELNNINMTITTAVSTINMLSLSYLDTPKISNLSLRNDTYAAGAPAQNTITMSSCVSPYLSGVNIYNAQRAFYCINTTGMVADGVTFGGTVSSALSDSGTADYNIIREPVGAYSGTVAATNSSVRKQLCGFTASVTNGSNIAHGLGVNPTYAVVSGSVANNNISVTSKNTANIVVGVIDDTGGPGSPNNVYWIVGTK